MGGGGGGGPYMSHIDFVLNRYDIFLLHVIPMLTL